VDCNGGGWQARREKKEVGHICGVGSSWGVGGWGILKVVGVKLKKRWAW